MYPNGQAPSKGTNKSSTRHTDGELDIEHTLLPNLVDLKALSCPDALWAEFPRIANTYNGGYSTITYRQYAGAINGAAWWLKRTLGHGQDFETLAYLGPNDVRYQVLLVAAIKTGYKMFFTSPRNSVAAHIQLFGETKCRRLLVPDPLPPPAAGLLKEHEMDIVRVPNLDALLYSEHEHFPYEKIYHRALDDPIFVLHTSGSTDIPKPLVYTHQYIARSVAISNLTPPSGSSSFNAKHHDARIVLLLPPFHIAGVYFSIINAIYNRSTSILPLQSAIPTVHSLDAILQQTHADSAFLPPSILEDLSKEPPLLDKIATELSLIFWSGGPLSQAAGSVISSKLPLHTCYGSSEYGAWPELLLNSICSSGHTKPAGDNDSWRYFSLHPDINAKFRHRGNNRFELVLPRDPHRIRYLTPFLHFPELRSAYRTRDLFEPHPEEHGYWTYVGRADDIVVFSNGEKTNPIEYEAMIVAGGQPDVTAALVFGTGRAEAGLLLELSSASFDHLAKDGRPGVSQHRKDSSRTEYKDALIDHLWPVVEQANVSCPAHARIAKERILFTEKGRPFARAGKGTIQRKPTQRRYVAEIERLYEDPEDVQDESRGKIRRLNGHSSPPLSPNITEKAPVLNRTLSTDVEQVFAATKSGSSSTPTLSQNRGSLKRKRFDGLHKDSSTIDTTKVANIVRQICNVEQSELDLETDFFTSLGMDSVQVLQLCRALKKALGRRVEARIVFDNPSIKSLDEALKSI